MRIFPIYYLLIFTLLFFHKWTGTNIKEAFVYFATYTSNFYFDMIKGWDGIISHLWSLAVEEQFYFVWPWVILFTNKKFLPHIIIAFIAMGVVSGFFFNRLVTITSFDAFGLGALLAWQKCYQPALSKKFKTWIAYLALGALILLVVGMVNGKWVYLRLRTIDSLLAIYIINYIINNFGSPKLKFKFLLNNRFLIFIGKMSYGVYLYHTIIPRLTTNYLNNHVLFFVSNGSLKFGLHFTINFIVLLVISWFSFIFIERKFLLLKEKFKY